MAGCRIVPGPAGFRALPTLIGRHAQHPTMSTNRRGRWWRGAESQQGLTIEWAMTASDEAGNKADSMAMILSVTTGKKSEEKLPLEAA